MSDGRGLRRRVQKVRGRKMDNKPAGVVNMCNMLSQLIMLVATGLVTAILELVTPKGRAKRAERKARKREELLKDEELLEGGEDA